MKKTRCICIILTTASLLWGCSENVKMPPEEALPPITVNAPVETTEPTPNALETTPVYPAFTDFLAVNDYEVKPIVISKDLFSVSDLDTYTFDMLYTFEGAEEEAASIIEAGKNPGLGVRSLHEKGITGKGVRVGIIDQNLLVSHPEYASNIVAYFDSGCKVAEDRGSYHGASVTSILCGQSIGVAPDTLVYYGAAPSWEKDAQYFADCLNWMIDENEKLPLNDKIRLVSVSSSPTSKNNWCINGEAWTLAVQRAQDAGILVLDCRTDEPTSFVFTAYLDQGDIDDVSNYKPFFPIPSDDFGGERWKNDIYAPASKRTLAREYRLGEIGYRYEGYGGQSWALPYVSGVLALGAQVAPNLSMEALKNLLFETAFETPEGYKIIYPTQFIDALEALK